MTLCYQCCNSFRILLLQDVCLQNFIFCLMNPDSKQMNKMSHLITLADASLENKLIKHTFE